MGDPSQKLTRWAQILSGKARSGELARLPRAAPLHISQRDAESGRVQETGVPPMPSDTYKNLRIITHAESDRKGFPESRSPECMEHYEHGVALGRDNQLEEAVDEMVKALEIDPGYLWARVNAGAYLYQMGGEYLDLAERVLREAYREAQKTGYDGIAEVAGVNLMALNIDKYRISGGEKVEVLAKVYSFVEKLLRRAREPMFILHAVVCLALLARRAEAKALAKRAKRLPGYDTTAAHLSQEYEVLQGIL